MADIVTDLSIYKPWNVAVGFNNTFTFTFTYNNAPFDITGYTFSLQIRKFGESNNTVNLTQGGGLTNGGLTGVLTTVLNAINSALLTNGEYFWQLTVAHPTTLTYRWYNGVIRASKELYTGDTFSGVTGIISLTGTNINVSINLPGEIQHYRGLFANVGSFPATGGNHTAGLPAESDYWQTTGNAEIAGFMVPEGSHLWARQNAPTSDWNNLTGWKLI